MEWLTKFRQIATTLEFHLISTSEFQKGYLTDEFLTLKIIALRFRFFCCWEPNSFPFTYIPKHLYNIVLQIPLHKVVIGKIISNLCTIEKLLNIEL